MYRLKLICRRFNDVLENNAKALPRYQLSGLRIRASWLGPIFQKDFSYEIDLCKFSGSTVDYLLLNLEGIFPVYILMWFIAF